MRGKQGFKEYFHREATLIADAGGRVNVIGEHTDYHEGWVLPAAINLRTRAYGAPRSDDRIRIYSAQLRSELTLCCSQPQAPETVDWRSYLAGPLWALKEAGHPLMGADIYLESEVPFGGGLSSSASVEVALLGLALALAQLELAPEEIARLARRAENEICKVPCGAMDQLASAAGREGHVLRLDCRSLEITPIPLPPEWAIIVADSGVKHALGQSEYAQRQEECAQGLEILRRQYPQVKTLRDAHWQMVQAVHPQLSDVVFRRLRHVLSENERVEQACEALWQKDASKMGCLLAASHQSLRDDYQVSCPELDLLVELAASLPGVIGARLTGAGFGGNTVNLVEASQAEAIRDAIAEEYPRRGGKAAAVRIVRAAAGLSVQRLS
jgi:galactokinase